MKGTLGRIKILYYDIGLDIFFDQVKLDMLSGKNYKPGLKLFYLCNEQSISVEVHQDKNVNKKINNILI